MQGLGHQAHVCNSPTPTIKWEGRIHEQNRGEYAEETPGELSRAMGGGTTRGTLGLPNYKMATQETPYSLVYGTEAIIPTEMHVKTTVSGHLT